MCVCVCVSSFSATDSSHVVSWSVAQNTSEAGNLPSLEVSTYCKTSINLDSVLLGNNAASHSYQTPAFQRKVLPSS